AVVVVDDAGTLVRVGALGQALPIGNGTGGDPAVNGNAGAAAPIADVTDVAFGGGMGPTGLFLLALVTALAVTAGTVRRRLERRRLRAVLVGRLATLMPRAAAAKAPTLGAAPPAERGHA
ncbi:MAG: hypothetical protein ACAH79_01945, partial [Thermoleophilia bacterium]